MTQIYEIYKALLDKLPFGDFDSLESHEANTYFSDQFEDELMEYNISNAVPCSNEDVSEGSCSSWMPTKQKEFKEFYTANIVPKLKSVDHVAKFVGPQFIPFLRDFTKLILSLQSAPKYVLGKNGVSKLSEDIRNLRETFQVIYQFLRKFRPDLQLALTDNFVFVNPRVEQWNRMYDLTKNLKVEWEFINRSLAILTNDPDFSGIVKKKQHKEQIATVLMKLNPAIEAAKETFDFLANDHISNQVMKIHLWATQSQMWLDKITRL